MVKPFDDAGTTPSTFGNAMCLHLVLYKRSITCVELRRNVKWFRGGLVFEAHRLFYHSIPGMGVINKKKKLKQKSETRVWRSHGAAGWSCGSITCVELRRNVKWFRGGHVFECTSRLER